MRKFLSSKSLNIMIAAVGFTLASPGAMANGSEASTASAAASIMAASVGAASAATLAQGSGRFIVTGLESVGDSTTIFLRDASGAAEASVRLAGGALGGASLAAGSVVTVATEASGKVLMASGRVIAFIPNEVGRSLLGSARTRDRQ